MKKIFLSLIFAFCHLLAEEIEVSAREFIGDEKKKTTYLKGNVEVKRLQDRLKANEATIFLNAANRPEKMQAKGNVQFWLTLEENRKIQGSANEVIYLPKNEEYQLIGNVIVREPAKNNEVKGDKIVIRYNEGFINVLGNDNKPAKLIFKLEKKPK